jgi:2-polyprenyl-6-hydroxyphenyl methylase/3-demethylubiquinone-9 3-methyltransferase
MNETGTAATSAGTVDDAEVARFAAIAAEWWNPDGKFRPLHRFNPVRLAFLRDRLAAHFGRDARSLRPLDGLRVLDVGCGGGLISEPLARMGAQVRGIDAAEKNIRTAAAHAADTGVHIDYRAVPVEDLVAAGERFDAVIALEVVEHVADLELFLQGCAAVCRPGGALVLATLNRTPKSYLFAIVGAEYVLRWLPRGTHDWNRFVRPSELAASLGQHGVRIADLAGLIYNPIGDEWRLGRDVAVNYMAFAVKGDG